MAKFSIAELSARAAEATEPGFPAASLPRPGGVDPLGLRQINFDLMDELLPGLNNVARHIRPFVVIAWAWRRANQLARLRGIERVSLDLLQDFVDRIEVLFVWSQLLNDGNADLPGRQVLTNLVKAKEWKFGGAAWAERRKKRRYSTALSAPINYGPGLKMLGWVQQHPKYPEVLIPTMQATVALDSFEARMERHLDHAAFSQFGTVTISADEACSWAEDWSLKNLTEAESKIMADLLFGETAPPCRQLAGQMILEAASNSAAPDVNYLRTKMAGPPSSFLPPLRLKSAWQNFRRLQVRQLFRLALEALFWWTLGDLETSPKDTDTLVNDFLSQLPPQIRQLTAGSWLATMFPAGAGPIELIARIESAMQEPGADGLELAVAAALSFCLSEASSQETRYERQDRLPLLRALHEADVRKDGPVEEFLRHVFESWILAQHVYWSVGRGLADARARGKTLPRLRVVLDEGGWTLAPGASRGSAPVPTADRLYTAVTLAHESELLGSSSVGDKSDQH